MTLFCAEKPLSQESVLEKNNIINYITRTDPTKQRLNHLIKVMGYVDEHKFENEIEGGEMVKKVLYTISASGISTYLEIINAITKDEN